MAKICFGRSRNGRSRFSGRYSFTDPNAEIGLLSSKEFMNSKGEYATIRTWKPAYSTDYSIETDLQLYAALDELVKRISNL